MDRRPSDRNAEMEKSSRLAGRVSPRKEVPRARSSLFFKAFCVSLAFHVALFAGGAWITLRQVSSVGAGEGSIVRVSLIAPADAWTQETAPSPLDPLSADRWPVATKVRAKAPASVARTQPARPNPLPAPAKVQRAVALPNSRSLPESPSKATSPVPSQGEPAPASAASPAPVQQEPPQASVPVASASATTKASGIPLGPSDPIAPQLAPKGVRLVDQPPQAPALARNGLAAAAHTTAMATPHPPVPGARTDPPRAPDVGPLPSDGVVSVVSARAATPGPPPEPHGEVRAENRTELETLGTPSGGEPGPSRPIGSAAQENGEATRASTSAPAMSRTMTSPEPAVLTAVTPLAANRAVEFDVGATPVAVPRTTVESVPESPPVPPAQVQVAAVEAGVRPTGPEPQDPGKAPMPSKAPQLPSQFAPPPAAEPMSEARMLPLLGGDEKALAAKEIAASNAAPSTLPVPEPEQPARLAGPPTVKPSLAHPDATSAATGMHGAPVATVDASAPPAMTRRGRDVPGNEAPRTERAAEVQARAKGAGRDATVSAAPQPREAGRNGVERAAEARQAELAPFPIRPAAPSSSRAATVTAAVGVAGDRGKAASASATVEPAGNTVIGSAGPAPEAPVPTTTTQLPGGHTQASGNSGYTEPTPPSVVKKTSEASASDQDGLPAVAVRIERPHAGTTSQGTQVVAGQVTGGAVKVVVVQLNEGQQLLDVWGTRFEGEVSLREGQNRIRVVAMGAQGPLAEKSVDVQYASPAASPALKIVRPQDGAVLDGPGQDVIEVEGEVSESGAVTARVVFNEFSIPVPVKNGRFSATVPAVAPEIAIRVEVQSGRIVLGSSTIRVFRRPFRPVRGYALLHVPSSARGVDGRLLLLHRVNPADPDDKKKLTSHFPVGAEEAERTSALFAFPATQGGAYMAGFEYRVPPGESVEKGWATLFIPSGGMYRSLRLGPFHLTGKGRVALAKFLVPQGIFWDEDSWFTGTAESAESLTKFRYSSSVSWTERKGEPEFPSGR